MECPNSSLIHIDTTLAPQGVQLFFKELYLPQDDATWEKEDELQKNLPKILCIEDNIIGWEKCYILHT